MEALKEDLCALESNFRILNERRVRIVNELEVLCNEMYYMIVDIKDVQEQLEVKHGTA